jgi:peptide/nickel transport system substrate-binding protein
MLGRRSQPLVRISPSPNTLSKDGVVMKAWLVSVALVLSVAISGCGGCGSSSSSSGGNSEPAVQGGDVATFAQGPGATPTYIFPLTSGADYTINTVSQFQYMMYRPLYWYFGTGKIEANPDDSMAEAPEYSNGNKTVTVHLKDWNWSDGKPITSRDIEFWMNLVKANKENWAAYAPGFFPDNIVKAEYPDDKTAVFTLDKAYNPDWFTADELTQISPIPQHAWDKTSDSGQIGDYDRTKAGAEKVYKYLDEQSKDLQSWDSNPLWQVVSGPMQLKEFRTDGFAELDPNSNYGGPATGQVSLQMLPFTGGSAELNAVRQGSVDYGYVPAENLGEVDQIKQDGFDIEPWTGWSINYMPYNMTNPTSGPMFKQLYFRQAIQHLVDQDGIVHGILKDYGYPNYGPVPPQPDSPYNSETQIDNPYPFDVDAAKALLTSHGWNVVPDGVSTCADPGDGPDQCGPGVPAGAKAEFELLYSSGQVALEQEVEILQSDLSKVGIKLNLRAAPINTVFTDAAPCSPGDPCKWDIAYWGSGWVFAPFPSGEIMFYSSGGYNIGGYSNPASDKLIEATIKSDDPSTLGAYQEGLAKDLPVIWFPTQNWQVSAIKQGLEGATPQDPGLTIDPTPWHFAE